MPYVEEEKSVLEQYIGRRFPLAMAILIAIVVLAYLEITEVATALVTVFGIIAAGYYKDIGTEKDTIRLVREANTLDTHNND